MHHHSHFYTEQLVMCRGVCHAKVVENGPCSAFLMIWPKMMQHEKSPKVLMHEEKVAYLLPVSGTLSVSSRTVNATLILSRDIKAKDQQLPLNWRCSSIECDMHHMACSLGLIYRKKTQGIMEMHKHNSREVLQHSRAHAWSVAGVAMSARPSYCST